MDLPTYTNIWRIEKRLYKLYDFNLPMPLPIVQVGVFIGIFVFWVLFLQLIRVPFAPPWHVVYLVPPGLATYFVTRPVLEGKRLPELLISQLRYLTEPRTWCRLTAVHEPERVAITAAVWRRVEHVPVSPSRHAKRRPRRSDLKRPDRLDRLPPALMPGGRRAVAALAPARPATPTPPVEPAAAQSPTRTAPAPPTSAPPAPTGPPQPAPTEPSPPASTSSSPSGGSPAAFTPSEQAQPAPTEPAPAGPAPSHPASTPPVPVNGTHPLPVTPAESDPAEPTSGSWPGWRRVTRVIKAGSVHDGSPDGHAADVAGRAAADFSGTRRVVVLGCAGGAGQTTTALMLGHMLAWHRRDRCVAVDVNPGRGSLAHRTRSESPETLASLLDRIESIDGYRSLRAYTSQAASGLEVIASDEDAAILTSFGNRDWAATVAVLDRYYKISMFDPAAALAARVLPLADQLVLVAPASAPPASTVGPTMEWLRQHGCGTLASTAVLAVNGVDRTGASEDAREDGAGQGRGIVRIPRDERLSHGTIPKNGTKGGTPAELDVLHQATRAAYLRLAAVLADRLAVLPDRVRGGSSHQEIAR